MSYRDNHPLPLILPTVIKTKADSWNESTQETALLDAQKVLEALIAEYGVDKAKSALDNQGFDSKAYGYLLNPLHAEALRRRQLKP